MVSCCVTHDTDCRVWNVAFFLSLETRGKGRARFFFKRVRCSRNSAYLSIRSANQIGTAKVFFPSQTIDAVDVLVFLKISFPSVPDSIPIRA